jgi:hypothetical protein
MNVAAVRKQKSLRRQKRLKAEAFKNKVYATSYFVKTSLTVFVFFALSSVQ